MHGPGPDSDATLETYGVHAVSLAEFIQVLTLSIFNLLKTPPSSHLESIDRQTRRGALLKTAPSVPCIIHRDTSGHKSASNDECSLTHVPPHDDKPIKRTYIPHQLAVARNEVRASKGTRHACLLHLL